MRTSFSMTIRRHLKDILLIELYVQLILYNTVTQELYIDSVPRRDILHIYIDIKSRLQRGNTDGRRICHDRRSSTPSWHER